VEFIVKKCKYNDIFISIGYSKIFGISLCKININIDVIANYKSHYKSVFHHLQELHNLFLNKHFIKYEIKFLQVTSTC